MRHIQPSQSEVKNKTRNHGAFRAFGSGWKTFFPAAGSLQFSRRGRKGLPIGMALVLAGAGAGLVPVRAAATPPAIPMALLSLAAGNSENPIAAGNKSHAEMPRKKSFREFFKERGAGIDNYLYLGSDAVPLSDPVSPKPAPASHAALIAWPHLSPKLWIASEAALMVGTGVAGFLILSHAEKVSTEGAAGANSY